MRKGISLPLETVVLLILSAIVLGSLLSFFLGAFTPAQTGTELLRKQTTICQGIASAGCLDAPVATQQKINEVCGRPETPSCSGSPDTQECVRTCCRIFCGG